MNAQSDQSEPALVAQKLRTEARTLRFHIGRYHGAEAVDQRYARAAILMERAAEALDREPASDEDRRV